MACDHGIYVFKFWLFSHASDCKDERRNVEVVLDESTYLIMNVILQYIILTKEKQHILFTHPFSVWFSSPCLSCFSWLSKIILKVKAIQSFFMINGGFPNMWPLMSIVPYGHRKLMDPSKEWLAQAAPCFPGPAVAVLKRFCHRVLMLSSRHSSIILTRSQFL